MARSSVASIAGTAWATVDSDGDHDTWDFLVSHKLHYESASGSWDNGSWSQDGAHVAWETNDHYSDYVGTIQGATMRGHASNREGKTWTFTARKVR